MFTRRTPVTPLIHPEGIEKGFGRLAYFPVDPWTITVLTVFSIGTRDGIMGLCHRPCRRSQYETVIFDFLSLSLFLSVLFFFFVREFWDDLITRNIRFFNWDVRWDRAIDCVVVDHNTRP